MRLAMIFLPVAAVSSLQYFPRALGKRSLLLQSSSSFAGQFCSQRRSLARKSLIRMMPEGPEVRILTDQLQGGVGRRLIDIQFLSGRYVTHGRPDGFEKFAKTMTPWFQPHVATNAQAVDVIQEWHAKGKFIYIRLDNGNQPTNLSSNDGVEESNLLSGMDDETVSVNDDYQRSIWITLGMTGKFLSERIHEEDPRMARWSLELMDPSSMSTHRIYFHDQRNFGTVKFCLSKKELDDKLDSLGPDILDATTTEEIFLDVLKSLRSDWNICKLLMDQSKLSGIGNYILAECLYRANIDPFCFVSELDENQRRLLFREVQSVANESYRSQGLTRTNGGTFQNVDGDKGQFVFQLQCYGRDTCGKFGEPVIKDTNGPHKRTIWYTKRQLFKPVSERNIAGQSILSVVSTEGRNLSMDGGAENEKSLLNDLIPTDWKEILADILSSKSFSSLENFLALEKASGTTVYPPQEEIFSAFNLCPFDSVKVVIVGQDPYHGPGQAHGLAFSVRQNRNPPPTLKNIFREAHEDVSIPMPKHGNLEHWAKQGVLLLNAVLTVRQGEANSHKGKGWENVTDEVIRVLDERHEGLVFLLWGNSAAMKARNVDERKHVVMKSSHPSPLGATKTASPFLGSRCFSKTNQALEKMGKEPIDWSVV